MSESGTVVVLTPMSLEYRAVRAQLGNLRQVWHPEGTVFEVGNVPGVPWQLALGLTGEGNIDAATTAERAASWFHPRALFIVGVAGALKNDIALGDVVVATWVYSYHGGKEEAEGFRARPRAWRSDHQLEQVARIVDHKGTWAELLPDGARPTVHFKPIAAGEVVLNSRDTALALQLKQHYNDAVAIEMESAGAAAAAHHNTSLPVLTIRGISDKADGHKQLSDAAGLQPVAAEHAAAFTVALLKELASAPRGPRPAPPSAGAPGGAAQPPPQATWLPGLGVPRAAASALLELHLVPAQDSAPLAARRLAAVKDELIALGRTESLFRLDEALVISDPATVASRAGTGMAVTRAGQRSAWKPLPKDSLGAVLDPDDITATLAALLYVLVRIGIGGPVEAGLAVGVLPTVPVSEGSVTELPRTTHRSRTSMSPVRVPVEDVLSFAHIATSTREVAGELSARLLLEFRARTG